MATKAKEAQKERDELTELNNALTLELSSLRESQNQSQQLPNLEAVRDRVLKGLTQGRGSFASTSPQFKAAAKALDRFINEFKKDD